MTEYAVEALKAVDGTAVGLGTRTNAPEDHSSKTTGVSEAVNPSTEMDGESFKLSLQRNLGSGSPSAVGMVTMVEPQPPPSNPVQDSSEREQTGLAATREEGPSGPECIEKHSPISSADEALIQQRMYSYRDVDSFPTGYLEYWTRSGSLVVSEAARRVLEERTRQGLVEKQQSEDFAQVEAA